uniref:Bifunctional fucokinase/fucose pyrophosphorylase n=3 Tax=Kalanchoe fedtschenkoi TaxID=63787 RepID=A0A7N0TC43_KALFE
MENVRRRRRVKSDVAGTLRKSWYRLRLSVRHPSRVPTWDAILLTAASPEQAQLYQWQLNRAKRAGRIATSTLTLAVPDPQGHRIGSGAATLNALYALAHFLYPQATTDVQQIIHCLATKHILLLHAGGDSKRVPWANPMGKVFLPLPFLSADDPDGPVPLLFDHILAISSGARQAFQNKGGLFIMTGDVLPCFDATAMILPDDTCSIITVPITLDVASNHGVIVASDISTTDQTCSVSIVNNLLQKPNVEELAKNHAILDDGKTLLDTGIIAVRGEAWTELVKLSFSSQSAVSDLLISGKEMSLYEDLVAAWVPSRHEWLRQRPMGEELIYSLGRRLMFSYCAYNMVFMHFGTSSEILDHLSECREGLVGRRHLCSIPATTVSDIAASAVILSSKISSGVSIGEDSIVYDSSISSGIQIGSQTIIVGVTFPAPVNKNDQEIHFMLPDRHCLWQVPLLGCSDKVLVYCGLHDNPKNPFCKDGTFCGRPWKQVLKGLGLHETDLFKSSDMKDKCLWNAKIFPVLPDTNMLKLATWLMGLTGRINEPWLTMWRNARRVSLEELHRSIDYLKMCTASSHHQADLAGGIAKACIDHGLVGRNLSQLFNQILQNDVSGVELCKNFLDLCPNLHAKNAKILPKSRAYQVQVDLLRACNDEMLACQLEPRVWDAVASETASAVTHSSPENLHKVSKFLSSGCQHYITECVDQSFYYKKVKVELPVRVDFVGGWSDTPPWSLERAGCVLNMAINLEETSPIGTIVETMEVIGCQMIDDAGHDLQLSDLGSINAPFDESDPFRLVKSALLVTNIVNDRSFQSKGLKIKTWANVPRGSGLGTSSILAAAVVKALLQIMDEDHCNENVARLVLLLEQLMGTGGGWQDQIGGLYPGIKFTTSFPGTPLRLQVVPLLASPQLISKLQERLLVVFTGQVRLAHQVLQKVVTRYLQRDNILISSIKRLAALAKAGREALMNSDIDELGEIMLEAWRLHQELDPYCSNTFVDSLFEFSEPFCSGYKLVGAGGGGFALLLTRNANSARQLKHALECKPDFNVQVYNWTVFVGN